MHPHLRHPQCPHLKAGRVRLLAPRLEQEVAVVLRSIGRLNSLHPRGRCKRQAQALEQARAQALVPVQAIVQRRGESANLKRRLLRSRGHHRHLTIPMHTSLILQVRRPLDPPPPPPQQRSLALRARLLRNPTTSAAAVAAAGVSAAAVARAAAAVAARTEERSVVRGEPTPTTWAQSPCPAPPHFWPLLVSTTVNRQPQWPLPLPPAHSTASTRRHATLVLQVVMRNILNQRLRPPRRPPHPPLLLLLHRPLRLLVRSNGSSTRSIKSPRRAPLLPCAVRTIANQLWRSSTLSSTSNSTPRTTG